MDAPDSSTMEAITDETSKMVPSTRRAHSRGNAARPSVASELHENQPVTEAEIELIVGALGDTLAQILNPGFFE